MRRILSVLAVAAMMAAMMVVAGPAFATVHPLANSECADDSAASPVPESQDPPGITLGGPDSSRATEAQPIVSVEESPAVENAFKPEGCPAQK